MKTREAILVFLLKPQVSLSRALSVNIYIFAGAFQMQIAQFEQDKQNTFTGGKEAVVFCFSKCFLRCFFSTAFQQSLPWKTSLSPAPCTAGSFLHLAHSRSSVSRAFWGTPSTPLG